MMPPFLRQRKPSILSPTAGMEESTTSDIPPLKSRRLTLLSYHEIPEWYPNNEFIYYGHQTVSISTLACFVSLLSLHNETVKSILT